MYFKKLEISLLQKHNFDSDTTHVVCKKIRKYYFYSHVCKCKRRKILFTQFRSQHNTLRICRSAGRYRYRYTLSLAMKTKVKSSQTV